jgi:hypothetical protein
VESFDVSSASAEFTKPIDAAIFKSLPKDFHSDADLKPFEADITSLASANNKEKAGKTDFYSATKSILNKDPSRDLRLLNNGQEYENIGQSQPGVADYLLTVATRRAINGERVDSKATQWELQKALVTRNTSIAQNQIQSVNPARQESISVLDTIVQGFSYANGTPTYAVNTGNGTGVGVYASPDGYGVQVSVPTDFFGEVLGFIFGGW